MGRKVIPQTKLRLKTKLIKTGFISYTETGPVEEMKRVEVEEPEVTAYRIKRADYRLIGRMLWNAMAKTLLSGGREGREWSGLKDELNLRFAAKASG